MFARDSNNRKKPKQILGGTRKLEKVPKEKEVPPIELKNMRIEPSGLVKGKSTTWKGNLKDQTY